MVQDAVVPTVVINFPGIQSRRETSGSMTSLQWVPQGEPEVKNKMWMGREKAQTFQEHRCTG